MEESPFAFQGLLGGTCPRPPGDRGTARLRRGQPAVAVGCPVLAAQEADLRLRLLRAGLGEGRPSVGAGQLPRVRGHILLKVRSLPETSHAWRGLRPSLVFLSYHADLNEDKRMILHSMIIGLLLRENFAAASFLFIFFHVTVVRLREFLPPDSVIVYCKLELARTMYDDVLHEGIFGEFLFSADEERSSESGELPHLQLVDGAVPGPLSLPSGPSRHKAWWRPRIDGARTTPPLDIEAVLPSPSTSAAPLQFPWAHGYRQASAVGGDGGAVFRNVLPGVLVFKSLRVTEANIEGNAVTSHFVKEATEKTVQITSATVFGGMSRSQLDPFIRRLSEQFGSTDGTIAMAFPRNQDEALGELEAFERCFPSVPALANQATEFNVDGPFAPMSRLKLVLLLIKLLD
ncbi:hypothetical protein MRX96_042456 [Rhipicephalus microplus]